MARAHFSPALFAFLRELKRNNSREFFLANRARYETVFEYALYALAPLD